MLNFKLFFEEMYFSRRVASTDDGFVLGVDRFRALRTLEGPFGANGSVQVSSGGDEVAVRKRRTPVGEVPHASLFYGSKCCSYMMR